MKKKWHHFKIKRTGKQFYIFNKIPKDCSEPLIVYPESTDGLLMPDAKDWAFERGDFTTGFGFKFDKIDSLLDGPNGLIIPNNAKGATSCGPIFIQDDFLTNRFLIRR
jgi:hypothetical protein